MIRVAIFASGAGTNAGRIIEYFHGNHLVEIALIACNNKTAGVFDIAVSENIPTLFLEKKEFNNTGHLHELKDCHIDFIVLAGFLWKIPQILIDYFPGKIVNIHPALLPLHGGKGMYGIAVHEAVIKAGENQSGITIHFVDEKYDNGQIIFQASCPVIANDSVESLSKKIRQLEHQHFPRQIEKVILKIFRD
ncbi:MAG: phosphoribosylglycinamide formyltransferase [Ginsengibacter sp.]